ncbi:MAG: hypothetical protein V3T83_17760 [Acidobacteriota bacterium]
MHLVGNDGDEPPKPPALPEPPPTLSAIAAAHFVRVCEFLQAEQRLTPGMVLLAEANAHQFQRLMEDWELTESRKKPGQQPGLASLDFLPGGKVKVGRKTIDKPNWFLHAARKAWEQGNTTYWDQLESLGFRLVGEGLQGRPVEDPAEAARRAKSQAMRRR